MLGVGTAELGCPVSLSEMIDGASWGSGKASQIVLQTESRRWAFGPTPAELQHHEAKSLNCCGRSRLSSSR